MKTRTEKVSLFLVRIFILFFFICYTSETVSAHQKEAEEWFQKANKADSQTMKIEYYSKAIEFNPKYAKAYYQRGLTYTELEQYQKAIADFDKVIELNPKYVQAYTYRGIAYAKSGQYPRAVHDFDKAIALDSQYAYAYYNRGLISLVLDEYQKAVDDLSKVIELNPKNAFAYYNRGVAYALLKIFTAEACNDLYQAGILFIENDNTSQTLSCVEELKKTDSSSPFIDKLMERINQ